MNFIKENKGKIIASAAIATISGFIWYTKFSKSSEEGELVEICQNYLSRKENVSKDEEFSQDKLDKSLRKQLNQLIQRVKIPQEKVEGISSFFLQGFQMFFQSIKSLDDDQQLNLHILETHKSFIGVLLQVCSSNELDDKVEGIQELILKGKVEESIDVFDFIFSSLHFINEQDLDLFLKQRVLNNQQLRHLFLSKLIRHSHTCIKLTENSSTTSTEEAQLSNSHFYFTEEIIDLTLEKEFLRNLDVSTIQASATLFNHFVSTFNKNIDLFTLKEPFFLRWQRLLRNVAGNQHYISHLLELKIPNLLVELFKQLVYSLFLFTVSYNLQDKEILEYSELYQKKVFPYCSIMILSEESLKTLDLFIDSVKKCGMIFKYKTAFVTILHDFMSTLVNFYQRNNCSNFHNIFIQSITILITHCQVSIPSSSSISQFWNDVKLPPDCDINNLSEPYFRMNIAPFFEITGMMRLIEQLALYYEGERKKKITIFLQLINNKKSICNRLRILGFQYSLLQEDFEREEVQSTIIKHLFKADEKDGAQISFKLSFLCEKIATPLHLLSQISIEGLSKQEEKEIMAEELKKYTNEGIQYLINVFKLAEQQLPIQEALVYIKNGVNQNISLAELSLHLDSSDISSVVLKKDAPLANITELFFDRQMSQEGFIKATLNQDVSQPLYSSVDFLSEIHYRIFTKSFFLDFAENCVFTNPQLLAQSLTHALILFELIIDFIYQAHQEAKSTSTQLSEVIVNLSNRILGNKSLFSSMKQEEEKFVINHPLLKDLIAQLFGRIEKRLNILSNNQ